MWASFRTKKGRSFTQPDSSRDTIRPLCHLKKSSRLGHPRTPLSSQPGNDESNFHLNGSKPWPTKTKKKSTKLFRTSIFVPQICNSNVKIWPPKKNPLGRLAKQRFYFVIFWSLPRRSLGSKLWAIDRPFLPILKGGITRDFRGVKESRNVT